MTYPSVFAPDLLAGQVAVVTGGGSGIGRCAAHALARLGAHAVLVGRNAEKLQAVQDEIGADGGAASWHSCDIRKEDAVVALVQGIRAAHGRINGLALPARLCGRRPERSALCERSRPQRLPDHGESRGRRP